MCFQLFLYIFMYFFCYRTRTSLQSIWYKSNKATWWYRWRYWTYRRYSFPQKSSNVSGPKRIEKAKIGFIQFCISPPKTDMDHNVVISDYAAMDRVLKEERAYILNIVKQIKKAGCNVLLVCFTALFIWVHIAYRWFLSRFKNLY